MGKNFSDFHFEQSQKEKQYEEKKTQKKQDINENDLKRSFDEFSKLDNNELSARLAEEVKRRKDEGSFDANMLLSSVESVRAFLPHETYENLKKLIENLK